MNTHTKKSLAALKRNELVALAKKLGITKVSSLKSPLLIYRVLQAQSKAKSEADASTAPAIEVEATTAEQAQAEGGVAVQTAESEGETPSNIEQFPVAEQTTQDKLGIAPKPDEPSAGIFKVNRKAFVKVLSSLSNVFRGKPALPVLGCVLLNFGNGRLSIRATNLDTYVKVELQAETTGEAELAIPYAILQKFVARCGSDFLMAEAKLSTIFLADLENKTDINAVSAAEFPPSPDGADVQFVEISTNRLAGIINETIRFASYDVSRFVLNGIHLNAEPDVHEAVATDGHRIVIVPIGSEKSFVEKDATPSGKIIVATSGAEVLRQVLPRDAQAVLTQQLSGNKLAVRVKQNEHDYEVFVSLVQATFPNYRQVIPKDYGAEKTFTVDRVPLHAAINRLAVIATVASHKVKLTLNAGVLQLDACAPDLANGKEDIRVTGGTEGLTATVCLNPEFLLDLVNSWSDEKLTIAINDTSSPVLFSAAGKQAVIMPVRSA